MTRAISFLTGLIAVIAAVGSGLAWLSANVGPGAVVVCGVLLYAAVSVALEWRHPVFWLLWCVAAGMAGRVAQDLGTVALYAYVAVGAVPACWLLYQRDKQAHKDCPDCGETVKATARICRHCRYEFHPALKADQAEPR